MMGLRPALQCAVASAVLLALGALPGAADAAPKPAAKAHKKAAAKPATAAAPADATPEQIAAAQRVYYGNYGCEFKQSVDVEKSAKYPAYVEVRSGKSHWLMKPVVSSTGAVRLEDVKGETLMVQISSKSMLLNVKTAQRLVDDCVCDEQRDLVQAAKAARTAEMAAASAPGGVAVATPPPLLMEAPAAVAANPAAGATAPVAGAR